MNSLAQHIAIEEPDIIAVAIGPGRVDTEMQKEIRDRGAPGSVMTEADYTSFVTVFEEGKLKKPEWPGNVIAKLSLAARPELSGKFLRYASTMLDSLSCSMLTNRSWSAPELAEYREAS